MRKVIFTESQIRRLLSEDIGFGGAYNPEQYEDHNESYNDDEVGISDKNERGDRVDAIITDLLSNEKCRNGYPFFGSHYYHSYPLEEQNEKLKNTDIEIPQRVMNQLTPGKRTNNIKSNGKVSVNTADKIVHDTDSKDPINKYLTKQLHSKRENLKTIKRTQENGFQKKGGTKNNGGTAHTEKKNIVTFTYED